MRKSRAAWSSSSRDPPSVSVSWTASVDDGGEDLVQIEARADRLPYLPQCLELLDLLVELGRPRLQRTHEVDAADGDGGLRGERRHQLDGPVAERPHLAAPQIEHSDDLVLHHHGHAEHRPEATESLDVRPSVLRVGKHVRDLLGASLHCDATDERGAIGDDGVESHVVPEVLRDPDRGRHAERAVVEQVDDSGVRTAQPARRLDDGAEDALDVRRRAADRRQDLARSVEALAGLGELAFELLQCHVRPGPRCHVVRHERDLVPRRGPGRVSACPVSASPSDGAVAQSLPSERGIVNGRRAPSRRQSCCLPAPCG